MEVIRRLRDEFSYLPGLSLTSAQAQRLCGADASTSAAALRVLVSTGFLRAEADGRYRRSDFVNGPSGTPFRPFRKRKQRARPGSEVEYV